MTDSVAVFNWLMSELDLARAQVKSYSLRVSQMEAALREIDAASHEQRGIPARDIVVGMGQVARKTLGPPSAPSPVVQTAEGRRYETWTQECWDHGP